MNSQRKQTRPAVIFVDHAIWWGTFAQLAAVVRRRGARAVRVTTARGTWYNRLVDRLLFSRAIYLDGSADLGNVARLVADENVIDMQCTEYVCGFLAHGDAAAMPAPVGPSLVTRGLLLDKFTVGELGTARGVRTPPKLAADKVSVAEAVAAMGLPLVVKARVGASGDLVRIARTAEDVERAVAEMSPNPADLFFEQMITGKDVDYSVIVGPEGVVLDVVTRTVAAPPGSTTPPTQIEIVDAPDLVELGRLAVEKLGFTGIAHMDTVEDAEGRHWLVDLNLRAWGSMLPSRFIGVDFAAAYLYSVGLSTERPAPVSATPGAVVTVFPGVVETQLIRRSLVGTVRSFVRHSPRYLRWLGLRYWVGQTLAILAGPMAVNRDARERAKIDAQTAPGSSTVAGAPLAAAEPATPIAVG